MIIFFEMCQIRQSNKARYELDMIPNCREKCKINELGEEKANNEEF